MLFLPPIPYKPMPNYYFTEANGQKRLVDEQELRRLANIGIVTPNTPLETEAGHKGHAKQIPDLFTEMPGRAYSQGGKTIKTSILSWMFDFAFRDLRLPTINLWACRIIYVICCIAAILWGFGMTLTGLASLGAHPGLLIAIPLIWFGVVVFIFIARLFCEWYIIVFEWIVQTTKAARIYVEGSKKEGR